MFQAPSQQNAQDPYEGAMHQALTLRHAGQEDKAVEIYLSVLAQAPKHATSLYNLGSIATARRDYIAANKWLEKANRAVKNAPIIMSALGSVKCELGDLRAAKQFLTRALRLEETAENHYLLGRVFMSEGRFEEANKHFNAALAIEPQHINSCKALTDITKFQPDTPFLQQLITLDQNIADHTSSSEHASIKFALGKAHYDLKEFDKSFDYYKEAHALKAMVEPISKTWHQDTLKDVQATKDLFTPAFVKQHAAAGHKTDKPIFVVGMMRSGTTLVEQILSAHPDVYGAGELNYLRACIAINHAPATAKTPQEKLKAVLNDESLTAAGAKYLSMIETLDKKHAHIVDKQPLNYLWVGLILTAMPNAKIIHCARNPMDIGMSVYRQDFGTPYGWMHDLENIGHVYNCYADLMDYWDQLFPGKIHKVQYEDMVQNQEQVSRDMIDFCGLTWHEKCLNFHKADKAVHTASIAQVRQPIYTSSLQGWKKWETQLQPLYNIVKTHMKNYEA